MHWRQNRYWSKKGHLGLPCIVARCSFSYFNPRLRVPYLNFLCVVVVGSNLNFCIIKTKIQLTGGCHSFVYYQPCIQFCKQSIHWWLGTAPIWHCGKLLAFLFLTVCSLQICLDHKDMALHHSGLHYHSALMHLVLH